MVSPSHLETLIIVGLQLRIEAGVLPLGEAHLVVLVWQRVQQVGVGVDSAKEDCVENRVGATVVQCE